MASEHEVWEKDEIKSATENCTQIKNRISYVICTTYFKPNLFGSITMRQRCLIGKRHVTFVRLYKNIQMQI